MGGMLTIQDDSRSRLRSLLAELQAQVTEVKGPEPLQAALTRLVAELDLGAERAMRACPTCGSSGFRDATLCGTCWSKLTPPVG